ncbi:NAD-dependent epimerase/dehydratase family protein [Lutimonas sp.]|uniref:NAD-dependent epimerase/dehydratase family protein n=1 Tax=Lutimonas sp. TaxID=1872403 RepID=UPI003D9B10AE
MILVTGGTGLVGSHLLYHLLLSNDSVRAIHQRSSDLNAVKKVFACYTAEAEEMFNKIRWVEASLEDIPALDTAFEDITQVYHCAALVSFIRSEYKKMRRINIDGTTNIANLCISHKIQKLCFVSSVAAIENAAPGVIMDESDNWSSTSDKSGYSITKYGSEMEVWRASQEGVPVVIVNPGVIIGAGFWHKGSGSMFRKIQKGLKFYTKGITGFVGVEDVVKVMQRLMDSDITNERFVLVSENLSYQEIFSMIAAALNKPKPGIRINRFMSECIWRLEYIRSKLTLSPPLLTKRTARSALANHPYTSEKIKNEIGFEFESIKSCVNKTARCLNDNL